MVRFFLYLIFYKTDMWIWFMFLAISLSVMVEIKWKMVFPFPMKANRVQLNLGGQYR